MSLNVTFNGSNYIIPETGETGWGGNTTSYLVAIAAGALQKTGGSFLLSAETDFGAGFGLKSLYYKSRSANIAAAGILRLNNNSDSINWRNAANSADLPLQVDSSNRLTFNGQPILTGVSPTDYVSSIVGTANQVIASQPTGNVTLSLPQSINLSANVRFGTLGLGSNVVASSILSLTTTTEGFLPPRMTTAERDAIVSPATGLFIYNTTTGVNNYYNGSAWVAIAAGGTINTGIMGFFSYYPANGTTLDDQSVLYTDGTNIGIGITSSLLSKLHIKGGNANSLSVDNAGEQYTEIDLRNNGNLKTSWFWDETNLRSTFTAGGSAKFLFGSDIIASAAHHAFGVSNSLDYIGVRFTNVFTAPDSDGSNFVAGLDIDPTMTGGTGDTNYQVYVNIAGFGITTQPSETVNVVASLRVTDPQINVGAGGAVTTAALIYCDTAPTEGAVNAAIYVNSGNIQIQKGSITEPSYTFRNDTNTGMWSFTNDTLDFTTGGTSALKLDVVSAYFRDGTASLPALTFLSDSNTGFYLSAAGAIGVSTGGTLGLRIDNSSAYFRNGVANTPGITFISDDNTGLYLIAADTLGISTNGVLKITVSGTGTTTFVESILEKNGSATVPSYAFTNETNTGLYLITTNELGFTINGTRRMSMTGPLLTIESTQVAVDSGSVSAPAYSFAGDLDNGLYRIGTDNIALSAGGIKVVDMSAAGTSILGTNTNNNAAAGFVGEYVISSVSNQNVGATGVYYDITSITLTAGDWDLEAVMELTANGASFSSTLFEFGIATASGNVTTGMTLGVNYIYHQATIPTSFTATTMTLPRFRVSIASTTTYYLKGYVSAYTVATPKNWATLNARRIR